MKRLALLALSLAACYGGERANNSGECPAGEACSPATPNGLDFVGNALANEVLLSGPRPTAIGGTQVVALQYNRGDGVYIALDLPFTADDDGARGIKVDSTSGSQVTVRGVGDASNYLRILDEDGLLMDRKELEARELTSIEIVPTDYESIPVGTPIAFAPGPRKLGIALYNSGGTRLIYTSMQVQIEGVRASWDTFNTNTTLGTHTVSVTAGDKPAANIDLVVVDHADSVVAINPPPSMQPNGSTTVCFQASSGNRYIAGLSWSFNVDGVEKTQGDGTLTRNCVTASTMKSSGSVAISATAGGQSTSVSIPIGSARSAAPVTPMRTLPTAVPTAGDRAAL
jgi:hypothetical protein